MNGKHMIHGKKLVVWDWNGTLLDDTDASIESMNRMLSLRGMPELTKKRYKELFRFPVSDYYTDLGFDFSKESFDVLSVEFIANYRELQQESTLHAGAAELLEAFRQRGIPQIILSAMERNTLSGDVRARGIESYFGEILGLNDHYAHGKTGIARAYFSTLHIEAGDILILGDTLHDYEVAGELGCGCILVAQGHHPYERLVATGAPVQKNLKDILNILINP